MSDINNWLMRLRDPSYELDQDSRTQLADDIEDAISDAYSSGTSDGYGAATEF